MYNNLRKSIVEILHRLFLERSIQNSNIHCFEDGTNVPLVIHTRDSIKRIRHIRSKLLIARRGAFHINRKSKLGYATRIYIGNDDHLSQLTRRINEVSIYLSIYAKRISCDLGAYRSIASIPLPRVIDLLPSLFLSLSPAPPRRSPSIVFLGHPINTVAGARKTGWGRRSAEGGGGGLGQINGNHFGLVIREKLSFHWRQPIRPQGSTDLREFSIESQSSKRFRPRFRVTRTRRPFSSAPLVVSARSETRNFFPLKKGMQIEQLEVDEF